jgi:hypothetical protein
MAEFSSTPPASVTHPPAPAKPIDPIIHGTRLEFSVEGEAGKRRVVVRLSATSRLELTPMAALGVAGLLVRNSLRAAPDTSDERTILALILAEMRALDATPEPLSTGPVPGVE